MYGRTAVRAGGDDVDGEDSTSNEGPDADGGGTGWQEGRGYGDQGPNRDRPQGRADAGKKEEPQDTNTGGDDQYLRNIRSTERSRLKVESQRLAIEIRTFAAAEARVTQEARRLRMDEAKLLATIASDTAKHTGVPCGAWEDLVMVAQRDGSNSVCILQSGSSYMGAIARLRADSKKERGLSDLYMTPVVTDYWTLRFVCDHTE